MLIRPTRQRQPDREGPMSPRLDGWTEEKVKRLRGMWASRLTCAQIAAQLGGLSRNAVIGKARRLGLAPRRRGRPLRNSYAAPRRSRTRRLLTARARAPFPFGPRRGLAVEPVAAGGCGLLQLTATSCRWPTGEPGTADFHFCGASSLARRPYCLAHCRLTYLPPEAAPHSARHVSPR